MKILVIGHKGMLGTDLMKILDSQHKLWGKDIDELDITRKEEVQKVLGEVKPSLVINVAAYTKVDQCEEAKELAYAVNAEGAKNLALGCKEKNIRLLHLSTDYVFDGQKDSPYREDDCPLPLSAYGKSKFSGEEYIKEVLDNFLIVRTAWLYGLNGTNFVRTILNIADREKELKVVDDQRGSPTNTVDLAFAIAKLITLDRRGIYHITNQGSCSWYQFAKRILQLSNIEKKVTPIATESLKQPAKRPPCSVLDCRKFEQDTGHRMRSWEDALSDHMKHLRNLSAIRR